MAYGGAQLVKMGRDKEVAAAIQTLESIPESLLEIKLYSQAEACKVLDKDAKTLKSARDKRNLYGVNVAAISPLDLASIHFVQSDGVDAYQPIELLNFIKRQRFAHRLSIIAQANPAMYAETIRPTTLLGFQTWLGTASVKDTWPFCIQPSGRPVDFVAALVLGQTTNDIRWLTIGEFGALAAHTASQAFHGEEKVVLISALHTPAADGAVTEEDRRDRWEVPGGPI